MMPTDDERWEFIRRCIRLLERSPTRNGPAFLGSRTKHKEARVGDLRIVKYFGVVPKIEAQHGRGNLYKLIVAFHAKQTFSRRLEHFEWTHPQDVPGLLEFLRRHMILDDLAEA